MAQGATQAEWKEAHGSSLLLGQKGADLEEQMGRSACVLVMEYIPGRPLLGEQEPFQATQILRTAEDLGRCAPCQAKSHPAGSHACCLQSRWAGIEDDL